MKLFRRIITWAAFLALFILCGWGFRWLLVDDTESYTRLMMHDFYAQDNIDILFVGSSHCYAGLDPEITDEMFGMNTFNAGSSLQALDASYALIREAVERYDVKEIYLEMYYLMMTNDDYRDREQLTGTYIISDYMHPSLNKARFLLEASAPKYYINSFLPARRNWERLLHPAEVFALVGKKSTETYRHYLPFDNYRGKGFVANRGEIENGLLLDNAGFDRIYTENASADWSRTLREIIRFCEKKGVRLTLFTAPITLFQTAGAENYDEYTAFIREMIDGTGAVYFDFNYCREEYFDQKPEYFADAGHLNETGAAAFSRVFADFFTGRISEEDLFYDSMDEKIRAAGPRILGLSFLDSGDGMRKLKVVSTLPEGTLYTVTFEEVGGTVTLLMEDSPEPYFEIFQEVHGTMTISTAWISVEIGV